MLSSPAEFPWGRELTSVTKSKGKIRQEDWTAWGTATLRPKGNLGAFLTSLISLFFFLLLLPCNSAPRASPVPGPRFQWFLPVSLLNYEHLLRYLLITSGMKPLVFYRKKDQCLFCCFHSPALPLFLHIFRGHGESPHQWSTGTHLLYLLLLWRCEGMCARCAGHISCTDPLQDYESNQGFRFQFRKCCLHVSGQSLWLFFHKKLLHF